MASTSIVPHTPSLFALALPAARRAPAECPATVYLAGLRPTGRAAQATALRRLAALLGYLDPREVPWERVAYGHAKRLATALRDDLGFKPATARRHFAALRGVLHEAWRLGLLPVDEWLRVKDLRVGFGESAERGRALSEGEITALLALPGKVAPIVALGAFAGLRRAELEALDVFDVAFGPRPTVTVRSGKGGKDRVVPLGKRAAEILGRWIEVRVAFDGNATGPLFPGNAGQRFTSSGITALLRRAAAAAKIPRFSPHDLRRTYVTRLLAQGNDLATVAKLAGHKQMDTTRKYDKRGDDALRKAAETLD